VITNAGLFKSSTSHRSRRLYGAKHLLLVRVLLDRQRRVKEIRSQDRHPPLMGINRPRVLNKAAPLHLLL
jgi:hypothetical protein